MGRAAVELLVLAAICLAALSASSTGNAGVAGRFVIMPWEVMGESQAMLEQPRHGIDSLRAAGSPQHRLHRARETDGGEAV